MADKLTVRIYQNGDNLYRTEEILNLELDPLSYSGVDYWKQKKQGNMWKEPRGNYQKKKAEAVVS